MRLTTPLRRAARPSLIPLIDVMLVLLFFFMLVSSYGDERRSILQLAPTARSTPAGAAQPQQVQLEADGQFRIGSAQFGLPAAIEALRTANAVQLSPAPDATLQTLLTGWEQLSAAGIAVTLAEAAP